MINWKKNVVRNLYIFEEKISKQITTNNLMPRSYLLFKRFMFSKINFCLNSYMIKKF